jgi:hypothetical protein
MEVHHYNPESEHQFSQWKNGSSLCPTKVKKSHHTPSAHWWFYLRALYITNLFLQTKQFTSITSRRFYNETGSLLKLCKTLAEPGMGDSLHQCLSSNCCISTTISGCQKHACGPHLLYLPNMVSCELFWLPWIKSQLQGHHFHILSLKFKYTCQPPYIQFQEVASKSGRNTRPIA